MKREETREMKEKWRNKVAFHLHLPRTLNMSVSISTSPSTSPDRADNPCLCPVSFPPPLPLPSHLPLSLLSHDSYNCRSNQ
jgi:hypothetical protein